MTPRLRRLARLEQGQAATTKNALVLMDDIEPCDTHRGAKAVTQADGRTVIHVRFIDARQHDLDRAGEQQ